MISMIFTRKNYDFCHVFNNRFPEAILLENI